MQQFSQAINDNEIGMLRNRVQAAESRVKALENVLGRVASDKRVIYSLELDDIKLVQLLLHGEKR